MDCSLSGSSVHGLSQARIQEWVAISDSRVSAPSRNRNPCRLCHLHCQADSLPLSNLGSPQYAWHKLKSSTQNHDSKDVNLLLVNWEVRGGGGGGLGLLWLLAQQAISKAWTEPRYTWGPDVLVSPEKTSMGAAHPEFLKWERRWVILSQGLRQHIKQEWRGKVGAGGRQTELSTVPAPELACTPHDCCGHPVSPSLGPRVHVGETSAPDTKAQKI